MRGLIVLALIAVAAAPAAAQVQPDPCACSAGKPGFMRRAALTGDWGGHRTWLEDHGFTLGASYAGEVFASPGLDRPVAIAGLAALSLDLDLATMADPALGSIHVMAFGIHGEGLSAQIEDVYGVSNNVATDEVRLFEAWYDQPIGPAAIRAGLLSADQEFGLAGHAAVLMNATFGVMGQISANLVGPVYPVATPGVSARLETSPVAAHLALYDGDQTNTHGMPTEVGASALVIGQIDLWEEIKLGGWIHTARPNGVFGVVDHRIAGRFGVFGRVGVSPGGPIEVYADAGVRGPPGMFRKYDFASLGVAYARNHVAMPDEIEHHVAIEATYQLSVTGWMTIQPDVQVVITPDRTALVGAVRTTIAF